MGCLGQRRLSHFGGDIDGFSQEGAVLSGYLGVDYRFRPNALAGLAASYSALDLTSQAASKARPRSRGHW